MRVKQHYMDNKCDDDKRLSAKCHQDYYPTFIICVVVFNISVAHDYSSFLLGVIIGDQCKTYREQSLGKFVIYLHFK